MLPARYEQVRHLGSGANSEVYCAWDSKRQVWITWKWGVATLSRSPQFRLRWRQEVNILRKVSSSHIVSILDDGIWQDRPFMVLEHARETLSGVLHQPQKISTLMCWLSQLLCALVDLHTWEIIHQDINPDNLLIQDGVLWLTDFSVARSKNLLRVDGSEISGTMGWNAPEQQQRENKWIDVWTDIYSWGRVAHYLLQGSPIFSLVEDIVRKATATDSVSRFMSASSLLCIWEQKRKNISQDLAIQKHLVLQQIPIPFAQEKPVIGFRYPTWSSDEPLEELRIPSAIRQTLKQSQLSQSPKILIIHGEEGIGKEMLIRQAVAELKSVRLFSLDYDFFDGVMHCIREWVSPQQEDRDQTTARIVKMLLSHRSYSSAQKEKEAAILTLWARRNILIEPTIGQLFFIQYLQSVARQEPLILFINQPQKNDNEGEGFDLCSLLLSMPFSFPIAIVVSMHTKENQFSHCDQRCIDELVDMGGTILNISASKKVFFQGLSSSVQSKREELYRICAGMYANWQGIRGAEIFPKDTFEDVMRRKIEQFEKACRVSSKNLCKALAISKYPLASYVCKEYALELMQLFEHQLITIRGRWIFFVHKSVQQYFVAQSKKEDWQFLATLWRKADYEDLQIRNFSWSQAMIRSGHIDTAIVIFRKTLAQSLLWGRKNLLADFSALLKFSPLLEKDRSRMQMFLTLDPRVSRQNTKEWTNLSKKDKEVLLFYIMKNSHSSHFYEPYIQKERNGAYYDLLLGEKSRVLGDWKYVKECMMSVMKEADNSRLLIFAKMWYVEASLLCRETSDVKENVQQLLKNAQKLSSISGMACASYADGLWCAFQGKKTQAIRHFRNAIFMALLSNIPSIWTRAFGYLSMLLIRCTQRKEAKKTISMLLFMSRMKQLDCTEGLLANWLLTGEPLEERELEASEICRLWDIYRLTQEHHPQNSSRLRERIETCMHPFAGLLVERLDESLLSQTERIALVKQISLC